MGVRRRRRRRRRQRGRGLDVQKWLGKTGLKFHWPGYQYMGPGTHLQKCLKRGDPGINLSDKHAADRKMIKAIDRFGGRKTNTEKIVKKIMQAKVKLKI